MLFLAACPAWFLPPPAAGKPFLLDGPGLRSPDLRLLLPCDKSNQKHTRTYGSGLLLGDASGMTSAGDFRTLGGSDELRCPVNEWSFGHLI